MPTGIPTKQKLCTICGKMFLPKCPSQRICTSDHYTACPVCGKPMIWNTTRSPEPCSKECKKQKLKQYYLQKYGVEHPMQSDSTKNKFKSTMRSKYGVEHALQNINIKNKAISTNQKQFGCAWGIQSPDVREKAKTTMMKKYGADCGFHIPGFAEKSEKSCRIKYGTKYAMQSQEIQAKAKQTLVSRYGVDNAIKIPRVIEQIQQQRADHMAEIVEHIRQSFIEKYGVANCFQSEEVKAKIIQSCIDKYGVSHIMQNDEIKSQVCKTMSERYGIPWYVMAEQCRNQGNIISKVNQRFGDYLKSANIPYKFEHRINNYSYDIKIINAPTVIEINPTYTHNIIGCHWKPGVNQTYHKNKMQVANDAGFRCINLFDWDHWAKIIPMLCSNKHKIDASTLDLYLLTPKAANAFLKEFSIQGTFNKPAYHMGLVKNNTIYQMITISTPRYNKSYTAEIVRWQSNPNYEVIGGYSKLLKFVSSDEFYGIHNIVMYFDNAKQFDMDILNSMEYVEDNPPTLIWSKGNKYLTDRMFKKFGYKGLHTDIEMLDKGWLPIYNCGYKVYKLRQIS